MTFAELLLTGFSVILALMTALWLISLLVRNSSIVDIFWGAGFVVTCATYFALSDGYEPRKALILTLTGVWGLRLTAHIGLRNIGKGEDFRYQKWRSQHGKSYWWVSFLRVFLLQGVVMWIVSMPLLAAQYHDMPDSLTPFDIAGAVVWATGFFFEAVGDWQLARFKGRPENKGKVMDRGLWRYTRHPNYFGDALVWWGFFLIALSVPGGFLTIISPLLMNYLLVRVSGAALLEISLKKTKPEYLAYMQRTSGFIPRPPRRL